MRFRVIFDALLLTLCSLAEFYFQQVLFPIKVHHRRSCFLFLAVKNSLREKRGREAPARRVTFVGLASRSRRAHEGEVLPVLPWNTGQEIFFFDLLYTSACPHSSAKQSTPVAKASQSVFVCSRHTFPGCRRVNSCVIDVLYLHRPQRVFMKPMEKHQILVYLTIKSSCVEEQQNGGQTFTRHGLGCTFYIITSCL